MTPMTALVKIKNTGPDDFFLSVRVGGQSHSLPPSAETEVDTTAFSAADVMVLCDLADKGLISMSPVSRAGSSLVCECGIDKSGGGMHSDWCPKS